jgi:hypothetical protein
MGQSMHGAASVGGMNGHGHGDLGGPEAFSLRLPFGHISPLVLALLGSADQICSVDAEHNGVPLIVHRILEFHTLARRASFRVSTGAFH